MYESEVEVTMNVKVKVKVLSDSISDGVMEAIYSEAELLAREIIDGVDPSNIDISSVEFRGYNFYPESGAA